MANKFSLVFALFFVFVSACTVDSGNSLPPATELCDGVDNDTNGQIDDGIDCDGDGFCRIPVDNAPQCVYDDPDCNDRNAGAHPGATEICNDNVDNDCDGQIDEGCNVTITCYLDHDRDGVSVATSNSFPGSSCPSGWVPNQGNDCDDNNASKQTNCTNTVTCYRDNDRDGVATSASQTFENTCPAGWIPNQGNDCNDNDATKQYNCSTCQPTVPVNTGEKDALCNNGIDDDCDGLTDQNDPGCANVCLPITGGTLRVELNSTVRNACNNGVIIVWGPNGEEHRSTVNASVFQEGISSQWQGFVRVQLLCNVPNTSQATQPGYWEGNLYAWPSIGSKPNGVMVTFSPSGTGVYTELSDQKVINGPMSQSWLPACQVQNP